MPVTLKQLAATMGLHHSTVAYALSGKGTVKEATRQRVRETARELGYVANGLARRMRSKHSNVIGLVVPDMMRYFNELIQQLFRAALKQGYDIQVALTEHNPELEAKAIRSLMESRVDGVIIQTRTADFHALPEQSPLRQLANQGVPTIAYGFPIASSPFGTFQLPVCAATKLATEHLLELGHRRFALLLPSDRLREPHLARIEGARAALHAAGLSDDSLRVWSLEGEVVDDGDDAMVAVGAGAVGAGIGTEIGANEVDGTGGTPAAGRVGDGLFRDGTYLNQIVPRTTVKRGRYLLGLALAVDEQPTAILCLNEATAIGAILEAQSRGLKVPADLAVAATTRTAAADLSPMPLTTAGVDLSDVADAITAELVEWIASPTNPAPSATLEPTLVVGASTLA